MRDAQALDAQHEGEREKSVDAGEIRVAHDGPVTIVTIAREAVRNALDTAMRAKLRAAFEAAAAREETQAVILTGAGDKAFCAGQDVRELAALDGAGAQDWVRDMQALFACVRSFEKPVLCALNGVAAGLGFQLALMADVRIAAAGARMGQTEINLGLASMSGPWIMREVMGLAAMIEMTLTARLADAAECLRLGLVSEVVPDAELSARSRAVAAELAAKPPLAVALTKRRFWEILRPGFEEAMAASARAHRAAFETGEPQKTLRAFLERR
ncbi:MAG: enoyl-CoA hydratase-related protein [Methyloligellaceae bacterium]